MTDEEYKKKVIHNFRMNSTIMTIQSVADYCSINEVPLILENTGAGKISLYYFYKDKEIIKDLCERLPFTIYIEHFIIPNEVERTQKALIEYKDSYDTQS